MTATYEGFPIALLAELPDLQRLTLLKRLDLDCKAAAARNRAILAIRTSNQRPTRRTA